MRIAIGLLLVSAVAAADDQATQDAEAARKLGNEATERAKEYKFDFKPPKYKDEQHVKELGEQGRQRGRNELAKMIEKHDAAEAATGYAPQKQDADEPTRPHVAGRLVVALSSSMPEAMLRDYMVQLDRRPEAVVVFRGFIGGARTVSPTGKLIEKARRRVEGNPHGGHRVVETIVDPLVYRSLGIDRVPAVAWLPDVQDIKHCDQEDYQAAVIAYGAISVEAALREINHNGGNVPDDVIKKFGGTGWDQQPKR